MTPVTRIFVRCGTCGEQPLSPEDVELKVQDEPGLGTIAVCSYCCPVCSDFLERMVSLHLAQQLILAGVKPPKPNHPERWEAMEPKGPFTEDEMIEFGRTLERTIFPTEELVPHNR